MRIRIFPFGDESQASARLRSHTLARALSTAGHDVEVGTDANGEIVLFQKKRNFAKLLDAKRAGARVVYDFDDHYLLDESGARDEVLKMIHLADLVTVGSAELLAYCRRLHPNVRLFDNPVDILPGSSTKAAFAWSGRLGWFGNRTNLLALDALGLEAPVTTITERGDIEWNRETIDEHLRAMDLVLLPVDATAWTLAKNANRLIKCAALGVPFLASRTPEHERAIDLLGLPPWFLVGERAEWPAAIRLIEERYAELPKRMREASARARAEFDADRLAQRWLEWAGDPAVPGLALSSEALDVVKQTRVVVLAERTPERAGDTLASVRACGIDAIAAVSPLALDDPSAGNSGFDEDFFEIYPRLARQIESSDRDRVLVLQAGVELRPAALEMLARTSPSSIVLMRPQHGVSSNPDDPTALGGQVAPLPHHLPDLVREPFYPWAIAVPRGLYAAIVPSAGALWAWDLLLGALEAGVALTVIDAPTCVIAPETERATPLHGYRTHMRAIDPIVAVDLPKLANEWRRLQVELRAGVVERRRALFERWLSCVGRGSLDGDVEDPTQSKPYRKLVRKLVRYEEAAAQTKELERARKERERSQAAEQKAAQKEAARAARALAAAQKDCRDLVTALSELSKRQQAGLDDLESSRGVRVALAAHSTLSGRPDPLVQLREAAAEAAKTGKRFRKAYPADE